MEKKGECLKLAQTQDKDVPICGKYPLRTPPQPTPSPLQSPALSFCFSSDMKLSESTMDELTPRGTEVNRLFLSNTVTCSGTVSLCLLNSIFRYTTCLV